MREPEPLCGFNEDFSLSCKPEWHWARPVALAFEFMSDWRCLCGHRPGKNILQAHVRHCPATVSHVYPKDSSDVSRAWRVRSRGLGTSGSIGELRDTEEQCFSGRCEADANGNSRRFSPASLRCAITLFAHCFNLSPFKIPYRYQINKPRAVPADGNVPPSRS